MLKEREALLQTISGNTLRYRIKQWIENFTANQPYIHGGRGVAGLSNMLKGFPAVIVGSGPTLDRNIKDIAALNRRALIIACDSAVKALENFGVTADIIMVTDSKKRIAEFLRGIDITKYSFVCDTFIHPDTTELLQDAKRLYWYSTLPIESCPFTGALNDWTGFVGNLGTGGCVATTAWWMASRLMQADPCVLVGLPQAFYDPAQMYSNEVSKTVDTEPYESHLTEVFDIFGKACYTYPALQSFAWWFQDAFLQIPGIHINASEGGIMQENCLNMPLIAAIQQYLVLDFDPQEVLFAKEGIVERMFDCGGERISHLKEHSPLLEIIIDSPSLTNLGLRMGRTEETFGEVVDIIDELRKHGFVIDENESQTFNPDGSSGLVARVFRLKGLEMAPTEGNPPVNMQIEINDLRPTLVEMRNLALPPTEKALLDTMSRGLPPLTVPELARMVAIELESVAGAVKEMVGAGFVVEVTSDPGVEPLYIAKHILDAQTGMPQPNMPPSPEQQKTQEEIRASQARYGEMATDPNITQEALNRIAEKWMPKFGQEITVTPEIKADGSVSVPVRTVAGSVVVMEPGKLASVGEVVDKNDPQLPENHGVTTARDPIKRG
jgi:hypothetical protein